MNSNTGVVKQAYAAFQRGDIPAVLELLDERIDWHPIIGTGPEVPTAGRRHGRKDVGRFFELLARNIAFTTFEPKEFLTEGERVVVLGHYAAKAIPTGRTFTADWVMVYRIRGGKILTMQEFTDSAAVTRAFADNV